MSSDQIENEWLIRELETHECPDGWKACSEAAGRASAALRITTDIIATIAVTRDASRAKVRELTAENNRLQDEIRQLANESVRAEEDCRG